MQKWQKWALGLGGGAVVALVGLTVAVRIALPPERVKAEIERLVGERLERKVSVQDASVQLWPLGIQVKNFELGAPQDTAFAREPALRVPSLELHVDLSRLLQFNLEIEKIELQDLTLRYEVLADGRTNWDGMSKSDTAQNAPKPIDWAHLSLPGQLNLRSLSIQDAKIAYVDRQSGREIILGDMDEEMAVSLDSTLEKITSQGVFEARKVSVNDPALRLREGALNIKLEHKLQLNLRQQKLKLEALSLGLGDSRLDLEMKAQDFITGVPAFDLRWKTNSWDLSKLFAQVPQNLHPDLAKTTVMGKAQTDGQLDFAQGKAQNWKVNLKLEGVGLAHTEAPAKISGLGLSLESSPDRLALSNLNADIGGQQVYAQMVVDGLRAQPYLRSMETRADLNLAGVMALLEKTGVLPKGYAISGQMLAQIKGQGPLDLNRPEALNLAGQFALRGLSVRAPQVPEVLQYDGEIRIDSRNLNQKGRLSLAGAVMDQEAQVRDYLAVILPEMSGSKVAHATARVSAARLDVDRLLAILGGSTPKQPSAPMTEYPSLPQNLAADLDVQVGQAIAMGITVSDLRAKLNYGASTIKGQWSALLYGGPMDQSFEAVITSPHNAKVSTRFTGRQIEVNELFSRLNDQLGNSPLHKELKKLDNVVYGRADLTADVRASGAPQNLAQSLDGAVSVSMRNGQIKEAPQIRAFANAFNGALAGLQAQLPQVGQLAKLKAFRFPAQTSFKSFQGDLAFEKGALVVRDLNVDNPDLGWVLALGRLGLDTQLDLAMKYNLPEYLSQDILAYQSSMFDKAGALAPGFKELMPGTLSVLPVHQGRVALDFKVGGTLSNPKILLNTQAMKSLGASLKDALRAKADALRAQGEAKLKAEADKLKSAAQAKLDAEKAKLQSQYDSEKAKAQARVEEEKRKAQERIAAERKAAEDRAKQAAGDKAKEALKKFGF